MRKMNYVIAAGLASALMLGGCSASVETKTEISTTTTDENGSTTTETTTTTTTTGTDGSSTTTETTTTTEEAPVIEVGSWTKGWMGSTDKGYTVYYSESEDGGAQGMVVLYNESTKEIESFIGTNEAVEDADGVLTVTTTDAGPAHHSMTFTLANHTDDNNIDVDLGSDYGKGTLEYVGMEAVADAIKAVDTEGKVFA